jgi:citrate lyase subunit beta / citryl-CoA lyase
VTRGNRSRRSCLAVPGSSPRFLEKAQGLNADQVLLDLEDAVAPEAKRDARAHVAAALRDGHWDGKVTTVRVNGALTGWAHRDVIDVVEQAGRHLDAIVLPKVAGPDQIAWLDLLLGQVEQAAGLPPGRIGIEAQIEDARGLAEVDAIAGASPRLEALVFGPADFMASLGMRSLEIGAQPQGYAGATRSTTRCCGCWSPRARTGCRPSTARTPRSATTTGCAGPPSRPRRSATTGNG